MTVLPYRKAASAVISGGVSTYTFDAIPAGQAASLTVSVPNSAAGVSWMVSISGFQVGAANGATSAGPFWLGSNDIMVVSGTPPGGVNQGTCTAVGEIAPPDELPPSPPQPSGGAGQAFTLLTALAAGSTTVNVTPSPAASQLLVFGAQSALTCNGVSSGLPLAVIAGGGLQAIPLPGSTGDQTAGYTVMLATSQATPIWIYQAALPVITVSPAGQSTIVSLGTQATGSDWSYQLGGGVRLESVVAELSASSATPTRYPLIEVVFGATPIGYWPGSSSAQPASKNAFYTWAIGNAISGLIAGAGASMFAEAPLPNMILQSAAIVKSNTQNLDVGDVWMSVTLTFSPV